MEIDMASALLTHDMCVKAWDIILPSIARAAEVGLTNKFDGTLLVLDPTIQYRHGVSVINDAILFTRRVIVSSTPTVYDNVVEEKAEVSWRTGRSSREIQQTAPHLYQEDDVKWGGSVVRDDLIVSFSGVQAEFDEWIAGMMADLLIAMCRNAMSHEYGLMAPDTGSYVS